MVITLISLWILSGIFISGAYVLSETNKIDIKDVIFILIVSIGGPINILVTLMLSDNFGNKVLYERKKK